ncbi:MAG: hypothetical protein JWN61_1795 [Pseudonocardiales bacterium]|nr:hypothetical protein [Jatrophihabitantaceae bacterium]MCW2603660.1 hypothetical protein [Pseudonocardiales bacterium]
MTPASVRATDRPGPRLTAAVLLALVVGAALFAVLGDAGLRASASYLVAAILAGGLLFGGIAAVRLFSSEAPGLSLLIAMMTYLTTVAVFGAVLALASPDVIDGPGFAAGLVLMVVASTIQQWRVNRVPPGAHPPLPPPLGYVDVDEAEDE